MKSKLIKSNSHHFKITPEQQKASSGVLRGVGTWKEQINFKAIKLEYF